MGFDSRLEAGFHSLGFEGTRPVQGAVIPVALEGHDVVACAETGTGKTLAFAAPIIERLLSEVPGYGDAARENYTRALILAPTRELAVQIEDSLVGLTYHTPVTSAAVFGGVEMGPQERALQAGVDIVVATPGRLMDHMRHSNTDFVRVQVLVLDEADRMMDMGFWPDVQKIMTALPPDRQTLLFSATLPGEIQRMATDMLRSPRYVQVGRGAARHGRSTIRRWTSSRARKSTGWHRLPRAMRMVRCWCSCAPRLAPIAWRGISWRRASRPRRCTPIARSRNGYRRWKGSARGSTRCWWPPTSPRAASTSRASHTSSISKCQIRRIPTCTGWDARADPGRRGTQ